MQSKFDYIPPNLVSEGLDFQVEREDDREDDRVYDEQRGEKIRALYENEWEAS